MHLLFLRPLKKVVSIKKSHKFYLIQQLLVGSVGNVFLGGKTKVLVAGQNEVLLSQEYGDLGLIEESRRAS